MDESQPSPWLVKTISLYLLKRVSDDMGGQPLRKQVARIIQTLNSMIEFITVSWMLNEIYVALFPYLALKAPFKITISMYYMIYQSNTYTDTSSKT